MVPLLSNTKDFLMRCLYAIVSTFLWVGAAFAQSSPGLYYGQVPTADQWNSYFASKLDYNPNGGGLGQGVVTAYNLAAGAAASNLGSVGGGCLTGTWATLNVQASCIQSTLGSGAAGLANFQTLTYGSGLPIFGAGSGAFTTGTLSGNTQKLITADGTLISGHCPQIDSYGGIVDSGSACNTGGGGSGTVTSGTANQLAYYASTGTSVAGLSSANNSALVTSSSGVPSFSNVLPLLVQQNINAGNIGGTSLNPTIRSSSLTSVGTLGSLNVSGAATIQLIQILLQSVA